MAVVSSLMTTEDLLAMPDDGVDRELIRGELRENSMTTRSGPHCIVLCNLAALLKGWQRRQPKPWGRFYGGDARVRIRRDPDTFVGIDIAYLNPEQAARTAFDAKFIDEPPTLAIEILSPSDTAEGIAEKVREYLDAGLALVWEVNPFFQTITVHRPDAPPVLFNNTHDLTAEPHLPGFLAPMSEVFES